jgi:hypothetical protein
VDRRCAIRASTLDASAPRKIGHRALLAQQRNHGPVLVSSRSGADSLRPQSATRQGMPRIAAHTHPNLSLEKIAELSQRPPTSVVVGTRIIAGTSPAHPPGQLARTRRDKPANLGVFGQAVSRLVSIHWLSSPDLMDMVSGEYVPYRPI